MWAQPELDSLLIMWQDDSYPDTTRLKAVQSIAMGVYIYSQPDSAFYYAQLQYDFAESKGLKEQMANALIIQGASYQVRSDYPHALEYYQKSLETYEEIGDKLGMANILGNIGLIYNDLKNYSRALEYFHKSLTIKEEIGDKEGMANSLNNIGLIYANQGNNLKALNNFKKALAIDEEIENRTGIAASLNNVGMIYKRQGESLKALEYFQKSMYLAEEFGDEPTIANSLNNIGMLNKDLGQLQASLENCKKGLTIAVEIGALGLQKNACECLYSSHKALGNFNDALTYHERFVILQDSIFNKENTEKLTRLEMQYEFDKQEAARQAEQEKKDALATQEIKREKIVRNTFIGGFTIVLLFAGVFFLQRNKIGKEKVRSEELLLNILPEEVAEELKDKGHSDAQLIDHVTVLFTDFKGFTSLSEQVTPKELVADLHECFSAFDKICEKHGIEKIKTIGDAYMAAGGLPSPNNTHAKDVAQAALEMAKMVEESRAKRQATSEPFFEVRIGIHTGPVVAGIVGVKKFQYDIWGDTVNIASRMESSGEVGKVNISQSTYELLKDDSQFSFESRGKIKAKGKGEMEMYFMSRK